MFHAFAFALLLLLLLETACRPDASNPNSPILLFNGTGTSPNDVKAIESLLNEHHLEYSTVNSRQLNNLSESQLLAHRLLIIPGGNYITIGNGLTAQTTTNIHAAVKSGLNYLGICAGALLAGNGANQTLNLTDGVHFDFYAVVNRGVHKAAVPISTFNGPTFDHYWEDGPQFTGWGAVVAKYPDGTPAVVEGRLGKGCVVLCGTHPEAPENWRHGMNFNTPTRDANEYAAELIAAALNSTSLPHY